MHAAPPPAPVVPEKSSAEPVGESLPADLSVAPIAIIDDDPLNVRLIRRHLSRLGYRFLMGISDPEVALVALENFRPDVVLLDVKMPRVSGAELLAQIREHAQLRDTPVITLTASRDRLARLQILGLGVADFLSKPIDEAELSTRLRNVIEAKRYRESLSRSARRLKREVRRRTRELEASRREVVLCLARAAEYRDDCTGRHVIRVGRYAAILAATLELPDIFVEMIELAAQLHDVGKIGIPDAILHKPGQLTDAEMQVMRRHAEYGSKIILPAAASAPGAGAEDHLEFLHEAPSPMLLMAARIAGSHHERWDGKGYPQGLAECDIPMEARITSVADVFDALATQRAYKSAVPLEQCFEAIEAERGRRFDPQVVDACQASRKQFTAIHCEMFNEDRGP